MALWLFLVELMDRFGVVWSTPLNPWYLAVIPVITMIPREQVEAIYQAFGNVLSGPICGLTALHDDGRFNRSVSWVVIAEPDSVCRVQDLAFFLGHELEHALRWIRDGLTVWPGH